MATSGAQAAGGGRSAGADRTDRRRTPAQWYCLLAGLSLLLAGILGFIVNSAFDTGSNIDGDKLIVFEVNGIHNLVHLASGLLLLAASPKRASAKTVAIAFGLVYGLVTIIGLIDGKTVLGLIPVNPADNILHLALSLAGIVSALVSPREEKHRTTTAPATGTGVGTHSTGRTVPTETTGRDTRFDRELDPRDMNPTDRGEQNINR